MDAKGIALLRQQLRIQAENRTDTRWLDACLKKLSREAIKRSLDLLKRTEKMRPNQIETRPVVLSVRVIGFDPVASTRHPDTGKQGAPTLDDRQVT